MSGVSLTATCDDGTRHRAPQESFATRSKAVGIVLRVRFYVRHAPQASCAVPSTASQSSQSTKFARTGTRTRAVQWYAVELQQYLPEYHVVSMRERPQFFSSTFISIIHTTMGRRRATAVLARISHSLHKRVTSVFSLTLVSIMYVLGSSQNISRLPKVECGDQFYNLQTEIGGRCSEYVVYIFTGS